VILGGPAKVGRALRGAMLTQGVDLMRSSGIVSAAHAEDDAAQTVAAFEKTLDLLIADQIL
jgi:glutamate-1-semialdehyde aminotransferase